MSDVAPFRIEPNPACIDAGERARLLVDPGFGRVFTDHMATARWSEALGWHDAKISALAPLTLDPSTAVLHYAQEIFEGMKAYRLEDGGVALFRPEANARRFQNSARRMAMPEMPEAMFVGACEKLVDTDQAWIPGGPDGALYLRPFMIADEVFLGVRPAVSYLFMVIASSVVGYWRGPPRAISVWVSRDLTRAAPGGTGEAKCGGNYAASLLAQAHAAREGCDQVVFLDAVERRWIEELGGMNLFFAFADGTLLTPPLGGTILAGITRDSLITLARSTGMIVREEPYAVEQWRADAESGELTETFACGTAAVVNAIGTVKDRDGGFTIGDGSPGPVAMRLRDALEAIQRGRTNDAHGWVHRLA